MAHASTGTDYVPHQFVRWHNRYDDPEHKYRTLYCSAERITCLREVLGDLRPSTRAISDFKKLFPSDQPFPSSAVTWNWRQKNVLVEGRIVCDGPLIDVGDVVVRAQFERAYAEILASYGMDHFDMSEVQSKHRAVTQRLGRWLYEQGAAGVMYRSNRDDQPCWALFEDRAHLNGTGVVHPLTTPVPELLQVCDEYGLILQGPPPAV